MKFVVGILVSCVLGGWALSSAAVGECDDEKVASANVEKLDTDIVRLRDDRKAKEAAIQKQIDLVASSLIQRGTWTASDRTKFFAEILKSDDFVSFEKQKRSSLALFGLAAQTMVAYRQKGNAKEACISAEHMKEHLAKVGEINDRQYNFMLNKIQSIASEP
ncbi:hypothetical protein [Methyloversatilis sp. NSM2]|uniref:hypothetical protein n=1 Tax=Methyloversatilis sp. NSM2 TaxID=3134135 RepID=UPI0031184C91